MVDAAPVALDAIDQLIAAAAQGLDVWDQALSVAEEYVNDESTSKFAIGDLALLVEKRYGENRIEQFAKAIRKSVSTLKERRTVAGAYEKSVRTSFWSENENLTYSHFRRAIPIVREKGIEEALSFLEQASALDWTCEETTVRRNLILGKPVPPARKSWQVPTAAADLDNRVILKMEAGKFDAANIGRFIAEHQGDEDFGITLTITYTRTA